jgi:hypothetical protein
MVSIESAPIAGHNGTSLNQIHTTDQEIWGKQVQNAWFNTRILKNQKIAPGTQRLNLPTDILVCQQNRSYEAIKVTAEPLKKLISRWIMIGFNTWLKTKMCAHVNSIPYSSDYDWWNIHGEDRTFVNFFRSIFRKVDIFQFRGQFWNAGCICNSLAKVSFQTTFSQNQVDRFSKARYGYSSFDPKDAIPKFQSEVTGGYTQTANCNPFYVSQERCPGPAVGREQATNA